MRTLSEVHFGTGAPKPAGRDEPRSRLDELEDQPTRLPSDAIVAGERGTITRSEWLRRFADTYEVAGS